MPTKVERKTSSGQDVVDLPQHAIPLIPIVGRFRSSIIYSQFVCKYKCECIELELDVLTVI